MKTYLQCCMVTAVVAALGSFSARGDVIFQSATLGPPAGSFSGDTLSIYQYLGARFSLNEPVQVQAVGGRMYGIDGGSFFGAIVSLSSPFALPSGRPFDTSTIATVTFTLPPFQDADISIPLSVELEPGNYALIFGSGRFGASGVGAMPWDNTDIPGQASYFGWWNNQWNDGADPNTRFVVYGEVVPEPGTLELFAITTGGIALLKWRRQNYLPGIEKGTISNCAAS